MSKKVMMYYGGWDTEEMFDATQWFTNGMYKPRNIEADGSASNVTMLRNKPLKLTSQQVEQLPVVLAGAFFSADIPLDLEAFAISQPDLSNRYRYAYSAFARPNIPEDYYYLYLDWQKKQFVVTFSMDAQAPDKLAGKYVQEVHADQPADAEHMKVFAEITEAEHDAR
ncbi:hypothetical protein WG219_02505 [Ectopseudomonas mendocina]|uniref:Uncharacterized protein n=1 Tax=Ectopseudomonas mendocina TaxID=300 RepID=A0ABZ2RJY9_ECTME